MFSTDVIHYNYLPIFDVELNYDELPNLFGVRDERLRSTARNGDPAAAPLCAGADPGCLSGRRSRPELPDPGPRQTASVAARHQSAGLALHDPAPSACQRCPPVDTRR